MTEKSHVINQSVSDSGTKPNISRFWLRIWNGLTNPHPSITETGARRQAQFLSIMTFALAPFTFAGLVATTSTDKAFTAAFYGLAGMTIMMVVAYVVSRTRYYRVGSGIAVASLCLGAYLIIWAGTDTPAYTLYSTLPIAYFLGYALLSISGMAALAIGNTIMMILLPFYAPYVNSNELFTSSGMLTTLGVLSIVVVAFRQSVEKKRLEELSSVNRELQGLQGDLEKRVADRTRELELSAEVGSSLAQLRNVDELLSEAVELTKKRFDLYYCQVYLVEPGGKSLVLRAGTGSVGVELLQRGHRLPMGPGSINGSAASEKHAVIVANTEHQANFRANPLLPLTRSEIAVPMLVGERVMGVLDMQSIHPNAFSADNIPAFQSLAVQLAIAITNAELFTQAERSRTTLELQARGLVQTGWQDFLNAIDRGEYLGYTYEQDQVQPANQPVQPDQEDRKTLTVPMMMVGVPLGVIQLERPDDHPWTQDEIEIVSTIANQASRQIDNLRILDQADTYRKEAEQATRRLTQEGWQEYIQSMVKKDLAYSYDQVQVLAIDPDEKTDNTQVVSNLKLHEEQIGAISVEGIEQLSAEDQALVKSVSDRLSQQLESLRLLESTERGLQQIQQILGQTETLYEIGRQLNTARDEAEILTSLAKPAIEQNCSTAALMYLDVDLSGQPEWMEVVSTWQRMGEAPIPVGVRLNVIESPLSRLWINQPNTPVLIDNVADDIQDEDLRKELLDTNIHALAFITLTLAGRWLGVVSINWDQPHIFDTQETAIYQSLINLVAPVVESRKLFKQAQRRSNELSILNEMGRSLTSLLDVNVIVQLIYKYSSQLMDTTNFFVALYDHEVDRVSFPLVYNDNVPTVVESHPLKNGITDYIIRNGKSLLMSENVLQHMQNLGIEFVPLGDDAPALSWLGVPIIYGTQVLGVIAVQSINTPGQYKELDRDLLTAIASQAAIAIENARIFSQTQRQADFEAIINTISQRIQNTTSVENALQVAARELGRALGASRAAVQLGIMRGKKS